MNAKVEQAGSLGAADLAKLVVAALLVVAGIGVFYYFDQTWSSALRVIALLACFVAAGVVGAVTAPGRNLRHFLAESQFEMRKVVWPTRDETVRTTAVIIVVVIILSLLLGLIDLLLSWVVLDNLLKLGQ